MSDSTSDLLIRIKNAYLARLSTVEIPHSKMKEAISQVLKDNMFIKGVEIKSKGVKKILILSLTYLNKTPKFTDLEIVSKPGKRVYVSHRKLPKVLAGLGISVVSTPKGIMSDKEARKKKLGGELICKIW